MTEAPSAPGALMRSRVRPMREPACYAALDLGTNNCRLLIATPHGTGFRVVEAYSRIVRLGEGLGQSGRLAEPAMERALAALKVSAEKVRRRRVSGAHSHMEGASPRQSRAEAIIRAVEALELALPRDAELMVGDIPAYADDVVAGLRGYARQLARA